MAWHWAKQKMQMLTHSFNQNKFKMNQKINKKLRDNKSQDRKEILREVLRGQVQYVYMGSAELEVRDETMRKTWQGNAIPY